MRIFSLAAAGAALMFAVAASAAAGTAEVNFIEPDKFGDAGGKGGFRDVPTREVVLKEIRAHLEDLAQRNLADGQVVKIDVLDIDIAGRRDVLGVGAEDVRIYDDISPPRIKLRFALEEGGRVASSGEERLSDPTYLNTLARAPAGDPIRYERPMLTKWFLKRFVKREPVSG